MTKRASLAEAAEHANVLLYGQPKSGKTTAAALISRLAVAEENARSVSRDNTVVYIDAEGGLKRQPLIEMGVRPERIEIHRDITFAALDALFNELWDAPPMALVWDSISEAHKMLLEQSAAQSRAKQQADGKAEFRPEMSVELGDYGTNTQQMRYLSRRFRDLPCHTIFVALEKREQDERTSEVHYGPDLTAKLASDILGYVDVIGHTYTVEVDGQSEPQYWTDFRNRDVYVGGDRFHALPARLQDASADKIVGYINGALVADADGETAPPVEPEPQGGKARPPASQRVKAQAPA